MQWHPNAGPPPPASRSSAILGMPPPAAAAAPPPPVIPASLGTNKDNPIELDTSRTPKSSDTVVAPHQQQQQQQQQLQAAAVSNPQQQQQFSIAATDVPSSMTQWQQRTSNVVLTFPIDGIERMSDPFLQTIVLQVAMEIVGCEAQNLGIRAVVIEADGCVLLRVFGLSRIVAKNLAYEQWSLNLEQAECIRSATYDAKFDHVRIEFARANPASSDAAAAAAAAVAAANLANGGADSSDASDSTDDNMSDPVVVAPPPPRAPQYSVRGIVNITPPQQQQQQPQKQFSTSRAIDEPKSMPEGSGASILQRKRRPRAPSHSFLVSMDADEDVITDTSSTSPAGNLQKSTAEIELEKRMTCLASVARAIARVAGSTAVQRDALAARAEIFISRRHPAHSYCTVNVGGIAVFDKKLLIPAYWARGIPASYKHGFVVHFDTAKKDLVVRISPPGQVDRLFHALRRIRAGGNLSSPSEVPIARKRRRRSSYEEEDDDDMGEGGEDDDCDCEDLEALGGFSGAPPRKYRKL